ncbi:MAG: hypothetical protein D6819_06560 [Gammaproteobacteria bacterium]|nr:MAG: hypothetical protein D6819_06560 [Gammaproteobacteria bacterium]
MKIQFRDLRSIQDAVEDVAKREARGMDVHIPALSNLKREIASLDERDLPITLRLYVWEIDRDRVNPWRAVEAAPSFSVDVWLDDREARVRVGDVRIWTPGETVDILRSPSPSRADKVVRLVDDIVDGSSLSPKDVLGLRGSAVWSFKPSPRDIRSVQAALDAKDDILMEDDEMADAAERAYNALGDATYASLADVTGHLWDALEAIEEGMWASGRTRESIEAWADVLEAFRDALVPNLVYKGSRIFVDL